MGREKGLATTANLKELIGLRPLALFCASRTVYDAKEHAMDAFVWSSLEERVFGVEGSGTRSMRNTQTCRGGCARRGHA